MNIEIANRLVQLRKKNGLSQEELADKLGLSRQAVSKWERAEASPDTDNLICLAKLYGVSLDELLSTEQTTEEIVEDVASRREEEEKEEKTEVVLSKEEIFREHSKAEKVSWITGSALMFTALLAYILVGIFWKDQNMGWKFGWTFILDAIWISTIVPVVMHKRITDFAYPVFVVALYCSLGLLGGYLGFEGWGVYWFLFITIPLFYILGRGIDKLWRK